MPIAIATRPRPARTPDLLIAARRALALFPHPENAELIEGMRGDARLCETAMLSEDHCWCPTGALALGGIVGSAHPLEVEPGTV